MSNDDIVNLIKSGMSLKDISKQLGISRKTLGLKFRDNLEIKQLIKNNAIKINASHNNSRLSILSDDIKKLINEGKIDTDIAKEIGCSKSSIRRIRTQLGIKYTMAEVHARQDYREKRKILHSTEEYRNKQSETQKLIWNVELRKNHSFIMQNICNDVSYIGNSWSTEKRVKQSQISQKVWSDAGFRKNFVEGRALAELYPTLLIEWDYRKNPEDPGLVTYGSKTKAWWVCSKDPSHEWEAVIKDRTRTDGLASGCPYCAGQDSQDERHIVDFINQFGFNVERRVKGLLDNKLLEIDIYLPYLKLGIELCGQYWHGESNVDKSSHYNKYVQAKDADIRLLTIFDSELHNRTLAIEGYLLSILHKTSSVVGARECIVDMVDSSIAQQFLNMYHVQGSTNNSILHLGLFNDNNLVSIMSFSDKGNGIVDLSRFCLKNNLRIPGGASKLLKHFIKTYGTKYTSIISFSDNRYSIGNLYEKLRFTLDSESKPSYYYFRPGKRELLHKFAFRKDAIENKLGPMLPNETEWQAMQRFGYDRIWDCGKKKWELVL